jgi:type IV pilus assembly protein PilE
MVMGFKRSKGFSLIELMVVVAIVGVLASVAFPSFMNSIRKSRRSDALIALGAAQQSQERYRLSHSTYGGTASAIGISGNSEAGLYTIAISGNTGTDYVLTASAVSSKSQASDTDCTSITITKSGATTTNAPTACWSQ